MAANDSVPDLRKAFESLSIIIPAYNAEAVIKSTLEDILSWLKDSGIDHEIIVVDDGSTDRTAEIVESCSADIRLIRVQPNRGKGHAVRCGMLAARGQWALFMDADNSTSIAHLEQFAHHVEDADVIIASRRVPGARIVQPQPMVRQTLGRIFPYLVRMIALPGVRDSQCGFKLFTRRAVDSVFPKLTVERFAFDVEVLLLARRGGFRIVEVPIEWINPTASTLRTARDSVRMLRDVIRIAWRLRWSPNRGD